MNNNNGKNTLTAATKLRKALSCDSVLAANGVCSYLDKYPEDMCEERTSWDVLKKYVTKLQYGFEALGAAINDALNTEVLPGDAMAMREALGKANNFLFELMTMNLLEGKPLAKSTTDYCREVKNSIIDALANPPRNCDVGTPEEQKERFEKFCEAQSSAANCDGCHLAMNYACEFEWAQMPYKPED